MNNTTSTSLLYKTWASITAPNKTITNEIEKRNATLVNGLLATSIIIGVIIVAVIMLFDPNDIVAPEVIATYVVMGIALALYAVSKSGHHDFAISGFIVAITVMLTTVPYLFAPTMIPLIIAPILIINLYYHNRIAVPITLGLIVLVFILNEYVFVGTNDVGRARVFWYSLLLGGGLAVVFSRHINALATIRQKALADANERLKHSEAILEQRVADRTQELEIAAAELRQSNKVKTQFLASMSHELRTPLNSIINFTEVVAVGAMGPLNEEQKELLDQSLSSSNHLLDLINDVLDITKIQAGKLNLFVENDVNIYDELNQTISIIKPMLGDEVELIQELEPELPLMDGDRRRIRQILLNLLSNAAKFTEHGSITIRIQRESDDEVLFQIKDTGAGIPEHMQSMIFEPFLQTDEAYKLAEGTGLGLPITRNLVAAHHGRLSLESTVGIGTTFSVYLPLTYTKPTPNGEI